MINHNKNPFDIWYDLDGLTPGTTYYYSLYAIHNGNTTETPVKSFTTKAAQSSSTSSTTSSASSSSSSSTTSGSISLPTAGWRLDAFGWWYDNGNGTWPANGWFWIDGNRDGIAECYYFTITGYILVNTITPDGYWVNGDGAWVQGDTVQIR